MAKDLNGTVVAITGGGRGIGLATARYLTSVGATVAIGDVDTSVLDDALTGSGARVAVHLDVTDPSSFAAFLDQVEAELGPVDVLVNNAGIMPVGRIASEPDDVTRRMLDINILGVVLGSKLASRRMVARRSGHVINIASLAGETPTAGLATYCATKAAVLAFTDSARLEHRGTGVHFSSVLPTFTNTELVAGTVGMRGLRNAEPEEIAKAVAALVRRPRPRIRRTRAMGALVTSQRFAPRQFNEAVGRALGSGTVFLGDVDVEARAAYEARARAQRETASTQSSEHTPVVAQREKDQVHR